MEAPSSVAVRDEMVVLALLVVLNVEPVEVATTPAVPAERVPEWILHVVPAVTAEPTAFQVVDAVGVVSRPVSLIQKEAVEVPEPGE
tara:strand:- start:1464 stop:1724 length:261 start_codon:yes stop_codon:yes gene_type:complete